MILSMVIALCLISSALAFCTQLTFAVRHEVEWNQWYKSTVCTLACTDCAHTAQSMAMSL